MSIFDFGRKQRLYTQLHGTTTGREMFKVDEYNQRKKKTGGLSFVFFGLLTLFYFQIQNINTKFLIFLLAVFVGSGIYLYYNIKEQVNLRKLLY